MLKGFGHVKWESTLAILGLPLRWKNMSNLDWQPVIENVERLLMVTLAIWLHRNEVMLRGRLVSMESVVHGIEGLMASWAH